MESISNVIYKYIHKAECLSEVQFVCSMVQRMLYLRYELHLCTLQVKKQTNYLQLMHTVPFRTHPAPQNKHFIGSCTFPEPQD
jgi:hypothetical protein